MLFFDECLDRAKVLRVAMVALGLLLGGQAWAQETPGNVPTQPPAPIVREPAEPQAAGTQATPGQDAGYDAPGSNYDPGLFQNRIPKDQLAFLSQFAGRPSNQLYREKQFRKLMHHFVPDCTYHYGSDKSMIRRAGSGDRGICRAGADSRRAVIHGLRDMGPHLSGKGFLWIDMQEGIGIGGFYFHPTNGEPTPTVNIFSKQVAKGIAGDGASFRRSLLRT